MAPIEAGSPPQSLGLHLMTYMVWRSGQLRLLIVLLQTFRLFLVVSAYSVNFGLRASDSCDADLDF